MQNNNQKGSLQAKFQGFGAAPSDALWGSISDSLDEKKKRRGFIWWWVAGSSAAIIITVLSVFNMNNNPAETNSPIVITEENINEKNVDLTSDEEEQIVEIENNKIKIEEVGNEKTEMHVSNNSTDNSNVIEDAYSESKKDDKEIIKEEKIKKQDELIVEDNLENKRIIPELSNRVEIQLMKTSITENLVYNPTRPSFPENEIIPKPKIKMPWEFGFALAYWNDLGEFNNGAQESFALADQTSGTTINQSGLDLNSVYNSSAPLLNGGWVRKNVNLNLFIGKYMSNRWAWRIGLVYSRTSYYSLYNQVELIDARTNITSIGIPVSMKFDMIKKDKFRLNTQLGVLNEFPFYEGSTTNYGPSQLKENTFNISYMGAVQLNVGAEFKISNNLFLGINPGFKYYFTQQFSAKNLLIKKNNWIGGSIGLTWEL